MCNNFLSSVSNYNPISEIIDCSLASKILNEEIGLNVIMKAISISGLRGENILVVKIPKFIRKEFYELKHEAPQSYEFFKEKYNAVSDYYTHKTYTDEHIMPLYNSYLKKHENRIKIMNFNHKQKFIPTNFGTIILIQDEFRTLEIKYNEMSEESDLRKFFSFPLNYC